jgi:hypothetical protein
MNNRRQFLLCSTTLIGTVLGAPVCVTGPALAQRRVPNMPSRNPWLADSVYPTSHFNPGATDSVLFRGPTNGRKLSPSDVKTVPTVITSNPAIKTVGNETIAFGSGAVGVQKLRLTGKALEAGNFVPYPGFEADAAKATPEAIQSVLDNLDKAERARDETQIVKALGTMETMGLNLQTGINGVYNLFDKEGYHYCVFGGTRVLKTFDDSDPKANVRIIASKNLVDDLPPDVAKSVSRIIGLAMTYDGYLAAAAPGAAIILDRDLNVKSYVSFGGEAVDNSICIDEKGGIYVVTSKRMLRLAWTGKKLSTDEADGAWESPYESMDPQKAMAMGAISRGSGTTPTLMGFGNDPTNWS